MDPVFVAREGHIDFEVLLLKTEGSRDSGLIRDEQCVKTVFSGVSRSVYFIKHRGRIQNMQRIIYNNSQTPGMLIISVTILCTLVRVYNNNNNWFLINYFI